MRAVKTYSTRKVVTIKFNPGALMMGRVVKTQSYQSMNVEHFKGCSTEDIKSWCNLRMRVKSVDLRSGMVLLSYGNERSHNIYTVQWPIKCLDEQFGIKIN